MSASGGAEQAFGAAREFSPWVEVAAGGEVYLDASGCEALWRTESSLATAIVDRAARMGVVAHVGVAGSKETARIAATLAAAGGGAGEGGAHLVILPGRDREAIARLSLDLLRPSEEAAAALRRWGLRRIGDLAALPSGEVALRLGVEGARLHRAACGMDDAPLVPTPISDEPEERADLEYPLDRVEPLLFVLRGMLDRLAERLVERAHVFGAVMLGFELDRSTLTADPSSRSPLVSWGLGGDSSFLDVRTLELTAPNSDVASILALLRVSIEAHPPPAPVVGVRLRATPARVRSGQLSLFVPAGPSPQKLAVTLARLAALVGADRVGMPRVEDAHRSAAPVAVRVIRPPRAVEVLGRPARRSGLVGCRLSVTGDAALSGCIAAASGPWKLRSGWWSDAPVDRDYWDVGIDGGVLVRIYRDAATASWFADGVYD